MTTTTTTKENDEMTIREAMNHISEFTRANHTAPGAATAQNAVAKICNAISQIQHLVK